MNPILPYALALGVENKWAEKFSDILSSIREKMLINPDGIPVQVGALWEQPDLLHHYQVVLVEQFPHLLQHRVHHQVEVVEVLPAAAEVVAVEEDGNSQGFVTNLLYIIT